MKKFLLLVISLLWGWFKRLLCNPFGPLYLKSTENKNINYGTIINIEINHVNPNSFPESNQRKVKKSETEKEESGKE